MKLNDISVTMRFNKGNYEHKEVTFTAKLDEHENPITVRMLLEKICSEDDASIWPSVIEVPLAQATLKIDAEAIAAPEKKIRTPKKIVALEETKAEEFPEQESEDQLKPIPPKRKTKAVVNTPYDRSSSVHTNLFSGLLDTHFPAWRTSMKAQAKTVSVALEGQDFLDEDGSILEAFIDSLIEAMPQ